jgi:hypothetical protein
MKMPSPKPDDPEQSKRFEDDAKRLEVDESGKLFERAMGIVVPPKGQPSSEQTS